MNAAITNIVVVLTQSVTPVFASPAIGNGTLHLCENGTGGYSFTFPSNVLNATALLSTVAGYCQDYEWRYDGSNFTVYAGGIGTQPVSVISPTGTGVVQIISGVATNTYSPTQYRIPFDTATGLQDLAGFTFTPGSPNVLAVPGEAIFTGSVVTGSGSGAALTVNGNFLTLSSPIFSPITTNQNLNISLEPSGTNTQTGFTLYNNASAGSAQYAQFLLVGPGSNAAFRISTGANTGSAGPIVFQPGGTTWMELYLSGGLSLGSSPSDPGAGNATLSGTLQSATHILTTAAPTVSSGQIGLGGTVAASTNCGTIGTGCIVINVAGTTRYITYY
jgi:hypothetical protein